MEAQGNIVPGAWLSFRKALALLSATALVVAPLVTTSAALAAAETISLSKPEVINAIEAAKVLAPGISVNADVYRDQVSVSTYRNARANDNDCKIEAAMIAKTVLDLAPKEISRVMIYFFSMANPTQYREVAVTAGDIKAFSAGQTDEKQLISSLKLVEPPMSSIDRQLLEQYVKSSLAREPEFIKTQTDDLLEVQSVLPGNLPAIDYQMEALRIAHRAILQSDITKIKRVKLYLQDPSRDNEVKTMAFDTAGVEQITTDIGRLFEGLAIVAPSKPAPSIVQSFPADKIELDKLETVPGDLEQERKDILERIRAFDKLGVGVIPFARLYIKIETEVGNVPLDQLEADVQHLSDSLDQQDKNYATAKDFHAVKKGQKVATASSAEPIVPTSMGDFGDPKQLEQSILKDPNGLILYYEQRLTRKNHPGELHPNFPTILEFFAATLRRNNRPQEAAKFEQRATALRAKRAQPTTTAQGESELPGTLKSGTPVTPPEGTSTKPVEKPPESQ